MKPVLTAIPLTAKDFAPFGDVIETPGAHCFDINDGFTTRHHALARADCDGGVIQSIFQGRVRPLTAQMLECHPLGTQSFVPLNAAPWLVVVAPEPTPGACILFLCQGHQGVQYARGVWHHPLLVLDNPQNFLVVDREDSTENLKEVFFDAPLTLSL